MPHNNISIFIPHLGCPHMCSFCNQRSISGSVASVKPEEAAEICKKAYSEIKDKSNTEIAFFGGSFTAIKKEYMLSLLKCVQPYIGENGFKGIRISTRPDCINEEILDILKENKVTAIELGAQSMCDEVLLFNERGHTSNDVRTASKLIKDYGFELGLQMMTGLYKSTEERDLYTADEIIKLSPDTVRIYPTVILKGTALCDKFLSGEYKTISLDEMVILCTKIYKKFLAKNIRVIKLGLHASETVGSEMVGGYYHPAFRELCEAMLFRNEIENKLLNKNKKYIIYVNDKSISKAVGQKKSNLEYFKNKGFDIIIKPDDKLKGYQIEVTEEV